MAGVLFISLNCRKILVEIVMDILLYKYIHDDDKNTIFMTLLDHGIFLNENTAVINNFIKLYYKIFLAPYNT